MLGKIADLKLCFVEKTLHLHDERLTAVQSQLVFMVARQQNGKLHYLIEVHSIRTRNKWHNTTEDDIIDNDVTKKAAVYVCMTDLPQAKSLPVLVRNMVPSSPHLTSVITSTILDAGLRTVTSVGEQLRKKE